MIWADIYKNISYGDRWIQLMEFGEAFWCGWSGNKGGGGEVLWGILYLFCVLVVKENCMCLIRMWTKLFECLNMQMIFGRFNGLWIKRHLGVQVFEFYLCKRDNKMRHVFQELNHFYI